MHDIEPRLRANLTDDESSITVAFEIDNWIEDDEGRITIQKDYRVGGTVWQVHKTDADPFPSWPHAHCVGGQARYIGLKLHLGTAKLYDGPQITEWRLRKKEFGRLIELIQPKFPNIKLPLSDS
ncbi:hypothetical protein H9643_08030 [Ochrobactrum sp. Sa2BUA5]|nr:hypothetical protein [Ochrobactrum gallinarum]